MARKLRAWAINLGGKNLASKRYLLAFHSNMLYSLYHLSVFLQFDSDCTGPLHCPRKSIYKVVVLATFLLKAPFSVQFLHVLNKNKKPSCRDCRLSNARAIIMSLE